MDALSLLNRIQGGEDSSLELKRIVWRGAGKINAPHPDSLADELAALANTKGGLLVLGVDDTSRQIIGIDSAQLDEVEHWLGNIAKDKITPALVYHSQHLQLPDAQGLMRYVIVVEVPRSLWIHKSSGGYMYRFGDQKRELSPDMLARLFQQRSQVRLIRFEEQAVPQTALRDAVHTEHLVYAEEPLDIQLQRLHLLTKVEDKACLSVAGVLFCTRRPNDWIRGAYIQAVAYRGLENDPADQIDAKDFDGPITTQIEQAYQFVMRHMLTPATKMLERVEYPQYSQRAIFEAITNAVVHRDYSIHGAHIRLMMFADRLELCVPGVLPNSMSIQSMTAMSLPRNDVLCSILSRVPMPINGLGRGFIMDKRGAGVDVILRESMKLAGKSPIYRMVDDLELQLTIFAAPAPHA